MIFRTTPLAPPRIRTIACAAGSLLLAASTVIAQPVVNPRVVEFEPSADHAAVVDGGGPAVVRYDFELYLAGASAPFHVVNLGKPTPEPDGKVRVDFSSLVASWPLPGGTYESRVAAVGPGGTGRSTASNQFEFVACTYSLSATTMEVGAASGSTTVNVSAPAGCAWTATSGASWVSMITTSGTGSGPVSFSYGANQATASRVATLTIAGQTLTLTQLGVPCTITPATTTVNLGPGASNGNGIPLTVTSGCAWTATTATSWITLTTASGTGNGSIVFSVSANTGTAARTGSITVGSQTVSVTQAPLAVPAAPRNPRVLTPPE